MQPIPDTEKVSREEAEPVARVIATVGLHSSASTWVFNIVRELLLDAVGPEHLVAIYAEEVSALPEAGILAERHLLIKSHHGSAELDAWLEAVGARLILSIRDPRDAAISMATRFNAPLQSAAQWIASDCRRLTILAGQGHFLLRYEDRFFNDPAVIRRVARSLGLNPPSSVSDDIEARYAVEAMRSFSRGLLDLPPSRLLHNDPMLMDRVTQIHRGHVGDTRSGKWRDLPEPVRRELARFFEPFLERFGY